LIEKLLSNRSHSQQAWLITGGCGFIGTNLIEHLLLKNAGIKIRVLDNLSIGKREDLANVCKFRENTLDDLLYSNPDSSSGLELIIGDISDFETCLKCCEGIDIVVHLAASTAVTASVENPRRDLENNIMGTFNMLEASRRKGIRKFIFASSNAAIGECDPPIDEKKPAHPVSPYGASKLAGEAYCSAYYKAYGLETVSLRFSNVYGPRSKHKSSVVAKFIRQAVNGETLEIYGDGKQTRDFIYIDDLIRAIYLAANVPGIVVETFQIATNAETTISELVEKLLFILSDSGINNVKVQHTAHRPDDVKRNFSDTSKAKKLLGWQAQVLLTVGLRLTTKWFLNN
jgi:UDP-glucose 4-epimerase